MRKADVNISDPSHQSVHGTLVYNPQMRQTGLSRLKLHMQWPRAMQVLLGLVFHFVEN